MPLEQRLRAGQMNLGHAILPRDHHHLGGASHDLERELLERAADSTGVDDHAAMRTHRVEQQSDVGRDHIVGPVGSGGRRQDGETVSLGGEGPGRTVGESLHRDQRADFLGQSQMRRDVAAPGIEIEERRRGARGGQCASDPDRQGRGARRSSGAEDGVERSVGRACDRAGALHERLGERHEAICTGSMGRHLRYLDSLPSHLDQGTTVQRDGGRVDEGQIG